MSTTNQDTVSEFAGEREKGTFNVETMANHLYNGAQNLNNFRKYQKAIEDDPILRFDPAQIDASRKDIFAMYCKKTLRYHEVFNQSLSPMSLYCDMMFDEPLIGAVHHSMFIPSIRLLSSDEQQARWLDDAIKMKIIGCYAQTELGHGSDVQNLLTTATFNKEGDCFILNTPEVKAAKWWVGELGLVANHAIVYAQLIIDGKRYGVQPFMVQLRDMQTHKPLPGIDVGDVGPKYGYNSKDNGFLILNNVKIPRNDMLNRYVSVTKDGQFVPAGNPRIVYATMMGVRMGILKHSYLFLSAQVTVATRYSVLRCQFKDENGLERPIMDYQTQQDKILPLMADSYAMCFSFNKSLTLYNENLERCSKNDFSMLQDLHALLSGQKAVTTSTALFGMEKVRQACGGHGFSAYSGMVGRLKVFYAYPTFEGENTVMLLQTARYLTKQFKLYLSKKITLTPQCEYLNEFATFLSSKCSAENSREFLLLEPLRRMMRFIACFSVVKAATVLKEAAEANKITLKEAFDTKAGTALCDAAVAHTQYFIFNSFYERIVLVNDEATRQVLSRLCALFALSKINEKPQALYEGGYITGDQLKLIREARQQLLADLRPDALGLAEAWNYSDNTLRSAIGSSKGNIYETLLDWAQNKNPVNKPGVAKELHEIIEPVLGKVNAPRL